MKVSRIIIIIVVVLIVIIVALAAYSALTPASSSPWKSVATYPLEVDDAFGVSGQQCVNSTQYVVCVGGQDIALGPHNGVYTSSAVSLTSGNITSWTPDSSLYPRPVYAQACVASSGYIYCVGGSYDDGGDDVNSSYYATLGSNGLVGNWGTTTAYPFPVDSLSCVASSGYIYCVGGYMEPAGLNVTGNLNSFVYFATLSSSGIGKWTQTTAYPSNTFLPSCFANENYIYCLGGIDGSYSAQSTDYYAPLSSAGVGSWTSTQPYLVKELGPACAVSSGYVYCVGGKVQGGFVNAVYYASVTTNGIGTWTKAANYPDSASTTCVISSGDIYCVGGLDSSSNQETAVSYYISLDLLLGVTTSS